ncbi:uncharacterized protein LOC142325386 [Lycorma delicatula]|uniref:uncharacterized protein LOC142325386 n=1 Tax=Lycorma delicatula TaxID=130591 RepID=UPI003F517A90
MTAPDGDDPLLKYRKNELESMQKVLEWLKSIHNDSLGSSVKFRERLFQVFDDDNESKIFTSPESSVQKNSNVHYMKDTVNLSSTDENQILLEKLNFARDVALKKWTVCKQSSNDLELKGQLIQINDGKVVVENFIAGNILSRPKSHCIKTSKGTFSLVGKLYDPNDEIPVKVKKYFNTQIPANWKEIITDHWNSTESFNESENKVTEEKNSTVNSFNELELESSNNTTESLSNVKNESSTVSEKNKSQNRIAKDNRKCRRDVTSNENKIKTHVGGAKNKNSSFLKKWTLIKEADSVILKGYLYSPLTDTVSDEVTIAGPVVTRNSSVSVTTNNGLYVLIGNLHDPESVIPEEIKEIFCSGFPLSWKNDIKSHWHEADDSVSLDLGKRRGKKRRNEVNISPNSKSKKSRNNTVKNNKTKNTNKISDSKSMELQKSNVCDEKNELLPTNTETLNKRNLRKRRTTNYDKHGDVEEVKDSESLILEKDSSCSGQKKAKKKTNKEKKNNEPNIKVKKMRASNACSKANKKKQNKNERKKNEPKKCDEKVNDDFDLQFNKTNEFFKTFDNDCADDGLSLKSFKEISIGGVLQSAKKKLEDGNSTGKETPIFHHVADMFSHSVTSNVSAHSAHSTPHKNAKRLDVVKRIQKLNKTKKKGNKPGKDEGTSTKHFGNPNVNKVYKQMTNKKKNAVATTPKIIKKIFRSKTPCDEDGSVLIDSSLNETTNLEDDFDNNFL